VEEVCFFFFKWAENQEEYILWFVRKNHSIVNSVHKVLCYLIKPNIFKVMTAS